MQDEIQGFSYFSAILSSNIKSLFCFLPKTKLKKPCFLPLAFSQVSFHSQALSLVHLQVCILPLIFGYILYVHSLL